MLGLADCLIGDHLSAARSETRPAAACRSRRSLRVDPGTAGGSGVADARRWRAPADQSDDRWWRSAFPAAASSGGATVFGRSGGTWTSRGNPLSRALVPGVDLRLTCGKLLEQVGDPRGSHGRLACRRPGRNAPAPSVRPSPSVTTAACLVIRFSVPETNERRPVVRRASSGPGPRCRAAAPPRRLPRRRRRRPTGGEAEAGVGRSQRPRGRSAAAGPRGARR